MIIDDRYVQSDENKIMNDNMIKPKNYRNKYF